MPTFFAFLSSFVWQKWASIGSGLTPTWQWSGQKQHLYSLSFSDHSSSCVAKLLLPLQTPRPLLAPVQPVPRRCFWAFSQASHARQQRSFLSKHWRPFQPVIWPACGADIGTHLHSKSSHLRCASLPTVLFSVVCLSLCLFVRCCI